MPRIGLADMNKLVDEVMKSRVTVDDLAVVLEDEYDLCIDYLPTKE